MSQLEAKQQPFDYVCQSDLAILAPSEISVAVVSDGFLCYFFCCICLAAAYCCLSVCCRQRRGAERDCERRQGRRSNTTVHGLLEALFISSPGWGLLA